ncbi:OsmC family protein [Brevibacterium sp. SMBL_HHYL_HB1]|jgi:putative redox protein|uniref:OsmC family protein n=1 Tax=Brevibacterium sp. SMBL_HHYL_HB1 TaxID=2777556 RepID=UPI001BAC5579|nr:OsmC family protein [Brevibacterium sp. SMBL_HHYL_HB1]QUL78043.1 OsmC family protein [Brevibacterium sp. SMBL_HHYL_HB1]
MADKPFINSKDLTDTIAAVTDNRALGEVTFSVAAHSTGGVAGETITGPITQAGQQDTSRKGKFTLASDEPVPLLGGDSAVSPAEYILQGLAGCYIVSLTSLATKREIELERIEVSLDFDIDLAGFLGIDDSVKRGAKEIRAEVSLTAPSASTEELQKLVDALDTTSPIRDTLANPVDVVTTLK